MSVKNKAKDRDRNGRIRRKPTVNKDKVRTLHGQGVGATEIARRLKIGRSTVYKILTSDQA